MAKERITIVPFDMKYLDSYYKEFNAEITKYQWPDPFKQVDDARTALLGFLDEMKREEILFYSILSKKEVFLGSVEMHGLSGDCPEIGVWIVESEQRKGYAYDALKMLLNYAQTHFNKTEFFYEADVRNIGSIKLLKKLENQYDVFSQQLEEVVTKSGKELKLQSYILKVK